MLGNKETTWLYIIIEVHFLNPYNHKSLSCMCCGCISSRYTGIQKIYTHDISCAATIKYLLTIHFVICQAKYTTVQIKAVSEKHDGARCL